MLLVLPSTMMSGSVLPLSNDPMFYAARRKPAIKPIDEIRIIGQVIASKENYLRLRVRRSTINGAHKRRRRKFNSDRELGARSRPMRHGKSVGV